MPFTPFHLGAALIVKPYLDRHFSLVTFGIAQIVMDIEPGIGMLTGADVLHGPTHTILGALGIAFLVALVSPAFSRFVLKKWNKEAAFCRMPWLAQPENMSRPVLLFSALFGTLSHVALDSLMHADMHPFAPFSQANPFKNLVSHDGVYQLCLLGSILGAMIWLTVRWMGRAKPPEHTNPLLAAQVGQGSSNGILARWVHDLRFTWFFTLLISVVPCILIGTGLFAMGVLISAVLIGFPAAGISLAFLKNNRQKIARRLLVMILVPVLTLGYVLHMDKKIPLNADQVISAIKSYRADTGHYPESLKLMIPKYLPEMPKLKPTFLQPKINYQVKDGKPYLSIHSAFGDQFTVYEYDFMTNTWKHFS